MPKRRKTSFAAQATATPTEGQEESVNDHGVPCDPLHRETYEGERTRLIDAEQKGSEQHDKGILTVTSGGLALSLAFLEKVAPHPIPITRYWLALSWLSFTVSLVLILGSFLTSQQAYRRQRDILDDWYHTQSQNASARNVWASFTTWLNSTSYLAFVVAVLFFLIFTWLNLH